MSSVAIVLIMQRVCFINFHLLILFISLSDVSMYMMVLKIQVLLSKRLFFKEKLNNYVGLFCQTNWPIIIF